MSNADIAQDPVHRFRQIAETMAVQAPHPAAGVYAMQLREIRRSGWPAYVRQDLEQWLATVCGMRRCELCRFKAQGPLSGFVYCTNPIGGGWEFADRMRSTRGPCEGGKLFKVAE